MSEAMSYRMDRAAGCSASADSRILARKGCSACQTRVDGNDSSRPARRGRRRAFLPARMPFLERALRPEHQRGRVRLAAARCAAPPSGVSRKAASFQQRGQIERPRRLHGDTIRLERHADRDFAGLLLIGRSGDQADGEIGRAEHAPDQRDEILLAKLERGRAADD